MCKVPLVYYNKKMSLNTGENGAAYMLIRKKMKSIRIRVTGDGRVMISAPYHVPAARIHAFIRQHEAFIAGRLNDIESKRSAHYPPRYADGDTFSFLGSRLRLKIITAPRRAAALSEEMLTLYLPAGAGGSEAKALFARWARFEAKRIFGQRLALLLPRFSGMPVMRLSIRDMITRWGSINIKRHSMSLSVHLLRCEIELIDYVITHELCHITYPRHTAAFYAALEARCPGRAQLDKRLEAYGLVGF